jgi:hypothetical protein
MASPNLQVAAPSVANRRGWPAIGRVPPRLTEHAIQIQDDARQLLELYRLPSGIWMRLVTNSAIAKTSSFVFDRRTGAPLSLASGSHLTSLTSI